MRLGGQNSCNMSIGVLLCRMGRTGIHHGTYCIVCSNLGSAWAVVVECCRRGEMGVWVGLGVHGAKVRGGLGLGGE